MIEYPFDLPNSKYKVIVKAETEEKAKERFNVLFGIINDNQIIIIIFVIIASADANLKNI